MELLLKVSKTPILKFNINTEKQTAVPELLSTELVASAILEPHERTYRGLEKRLQGYMHSNKELEDLVSEIQTTGIYVAYQDNLNIEVI